MQTLILAGGLATRLGSLAADTPKSMLEVAGRPFLELQIGHLARQGSRDLILCLGHQAEQVIRHFGDGAAFGVRISYAVEDRQLGTGGAIRHALPLLSGESVLVCNGDSLVDFDLSALTELHDRLGFLATMVLVRVDDVGRFGSVATDADGRVTAFTEKRATGPGQANAGVYLLRRQLVEAMPDAPSSLERDTFPHLTDGRLGGLLASGRLVDIGTPESLGAARVDPMLLDLLPAASC